MDNSQMKVSVICNAYNHEKYIQRCLDSLVMQKTSFAFEILVHDDASTDRTADIIRSYEERYPTLIKPVYQMENQYSKGGVSKFQYSRVKGEYIAICEGDDFWTDEHKLQRQFEALEAHPEVDICAHAASIVSEDSEKELQRISPRSHACIIPVEEVIYGGGAFVATNSLMYRTSLENSGPEFSKKWRLDYARQIGGSLRGGMLYLPETMSAYRWQSVGSWTQQQGRNREKREATLEKIKRILEALDKETDHQYEEVISRTMLRDEFVFYYMYGPFRIALSPKYNKIRKRWGLKGIIKLYIKVIFPFLFTKK